MTVHRTIPIHKFEIGQRVQFLTRGLDGSAQQGIYIVVRQMPSETRNLQYRIKDVRDSHERVVRESQLRQA